jgi:8-oxo-dGTP pyrophosphatase MutT (NUDIX family)
MQPIEHLTNGYFWDIAYRPNAQNPVHIIPYDFVTGNYLLIVQPRASVNKFVISFPAGLVDPKLTGKDLILKYANDLESDHLKSLIEVESDPILLTAINELKEETGYFPLSLNKTRFACPKSAGMTDESGTIVFASVDSLKWGKSRLEKSEDIHYLWLPIEDILGLMHFISPEFLVFEMETFIYFNGIQTQIYSENLSYEI